MGRIHYHHFLCQCETQFAHIDATTVIRSFIKSEFITTYIPVQKLDLICEFFQIVEWLYQHSKVVQELDELFFSVPRKKLFNMNEQENDIKAIKHDPKAEPQKPLEKTFQSRYLIDCSSICLQRNTSRSSLRYNSY